MFAVALVVRLIVVVETGDVALVRHLQGDAAGYFAWGKEIAEGAWLGDESFYQAPLYPYVLGGLFSITGPSVVAIRLTQCLAGALASAFLYGAARRMFGARAGLIAGLMLALFPPAIFADDIVQKTSLGALITCALLFLLARCLVNGSGHACCESTLTSDAGLLRTGVKGRPGRAGALGGAEGSAPPGNKYGSMIGLGVLGAMLCLVRENALAWLAVLFVFSLTFGRGRLAARRHGGALLIGAAMVLVPVAARNAHFGGGWSLTTSQSGPNFYIGNGARADGRYRPLVRGHETPEFERADATRLAEAALGRSLSAHEVSRYWFGRAVDDIRTAPTRWLALMGEKALMVINRYEVSDVESLYVFADYSRVLGVLAPVWHFGVLFPLAAAGIVLTRSSWRSLWVCHVLALTMWAAVAVFFVLARYRFPLVPVLTPFAAAGVVGLWRRGAQLVGDRRNRRPVSVGGLAPIDLSGRGVWWALLVGVAATVVSNWPVHDERRLDALAQMNLGVAMAEEDLPGATTCFERAVALNPGSLEARFNLGQALLMSGDAAGAVDQLEAAVAVDSNVARVHLVLGGAYERMGERERALAAYRRAVLLDSSLEEARRAIERLSDER